MEIKKELVDLLELSVREKASDLYLSSGSFPTIRVDGDLIPIQHQKQLDAAYAEQLIYSTMSKEQQTLFEKTHDVDFSLKISAIAIFRVNVYQQLNGISAVFRVIPQELPSFDEIGLPAHIKNLLNLPNGLILVTGPTGCGKSTTLAAMINYINMTQPVHIITIEDPIEYIYQNNKSLIDQRQVYRDTESFNVALRAALREAPDVILVGEMRDLETIRLVLTAAETGHLVMATLHTSSAPRAVSRVVDVFSAGEKNIIHNLLSESLQAVICQTLLKKRAGGRVAAFEIMLGTPAIRNLIREDKISQMYSIMQTSGQSGMCTLEKSFSELVAKNIIHAEAVKESGLQMKIFEHS